MPTFAPETHWHRLPANPIDLSLTPQSPSPLSTLPPLPRASLSPIHREIPPLKLTEPTIKVRKKLENDPCLTTYFAVRAKELTFEQRQNDLSEDRKPVRRPKLRKIGHLSPFRLVDFDPNPIDFTFDRRENPLPKHRKVSSLVEARATSKIREAKHSTGSREQSEGEGRSRSVNKTTPKRQFQLSAMKEENRVLYYFPFKRGGRDGEV